MIFPMMDDDEKIVYSSLDIFWENEMIKANSELNACIDNLKQPYLRRKDTLFISSENSIYQTNGIDMITKALDDFDYKILNKPSKRLGNNEIKHLDKKIDPRFSSDANLMNRLREFALSPKLHQKQIHATPTIELLKDFNFIFHEIIADQQVYIDDYTNCIKNESDPKTISCFLANRAIAFLNYEATKLAFTDFENAINYDKFNFLAYLFQGIIYLWQNKEHDAINKWRSALQYNYNNLFSLIMKHLIYDHNFRQSMYSRRYRLKKTIEIITDYSTDNIYDLDDSIIGYKKLANGKIHEAISQFNTINQIHPFNNHSQLGQSIAQAMNGDYINSSNNFNNLESKYFSSTELKKFRGFSYASLHHESNAVSDFSYVIQENMTDYEAILHRADVQMTRGHYKSALNDYFALPERMRTNPVLVKAAECHVLLGQLQKALDTLKCISPEYENYRLYYCHFLISRDKGEQKEALQFIKKAVDSNPSFDLSKIAGDYSYSNAMFDDAIEFYKIALKFDPESPQVKKGLAFSMIHNGEEKLGAKILEKLGTVSNSSIKYLDQWLHKIGAVSVSHPDIFHSRKSIFEPVLMSDNEDYRFILHIMSSIDKPFTVALRDKIVDLGISRRSFNLSQFEPNSGHLSLLVDAERIGKTCLTQVYESTNNIRLVRALGLSVLYLANYIKKTVHDANKRQSVEVESWTVPFDTIRALLQLVDLQANVQWISKNGENEVKQELVPSYYIQAGTRFPPRFQHVEKSAFKKLAAAVVDLMKPRKFGNHEIEQMDHADILYQIVQKDFSSSSKFDPGIERLQSPTISLNFLGALGYEVFVTPTTAPKHRKRYFTAVQKMWASLFQIIADPQFILISKKEESLEEVSNQLPKVLPFEGNDASEKEYGVDFTFIQITSFLMLFLWMMQPFSYYSNELAYIVLAAFSLVIDQELAPNDLKEELFISQMTDQDVALINRNVIKRIQKGKKSQVSPDSLSFWDQKITLRQMMQLIGSQF
ncbi:hypothetical protein TRFO_27481 [Tritrichomonas foetus]|uniref:TPR Domain containing protein n=1 Tax=Tritrichomonas foetus TaxID=1144522 RepID=A0A1J4K1T8_9EUKA|nr:hypothetical protein TRFO_27481 [Tritrichomonas foetus]|eukprot:OHT04922.1 hypothetical protein TRFO_27481 [Tritrichomonas foetus]